MGLLVDSGLWMCLIPSIKAVITYEAQKDVMHPPPVLPWHLTAPYSSSKHWEIADAAAITSPSILHRC